MNDPLFDQPGERVMWAHDYEKMVERERIEKQKQARAKAEAEAKAKAEYEAALPRKNKLQYTDEMAQEICERISSGELLINICQELNMPTVRRCNQWLRDNTEFNTLFKESINDRLSIFEEQIIQIADDVANDFKEVTKGSKTIRVVDAEVIARAKLRVEVRFKHLKAGKPQKWGDSTTITTKTEGDDPSALSIEDLERRLNDLDVKERVVKKV